MADTEPSDPSLVAPVAVLPIRTVAWEAAGLEKCEHEVINSFEVSDNNRFQGGTQYSPHAQLEDRQQPDRDLSQALNSDEVKADSRSTASSAAIRHTEESTAIFSLNADTIEKSKNNATGPDAKVSSSIPSTVSNSPVHQHATTTHSSHPPQIKRFTSVNITKRFLEKTSSMSGPSLGTGSISNTNQVSSSSNQHLGISQNSRSPSFDRPVSSRLVTAKLTAVPQPSSASTSGWLRPGQATNSNTTPTPRSTSPQPPLLESTTSSLQSIKRRSGTSPVPNGTPSSANSQSNKAVWSKYAASNSNSTGRGLSSLDNKNDFPTAAEAVHSLQSLRKGKPGKGQTEAADIAAAAQRTAHRNALNETAAAFRGTHLDVNARWDEMSDEDSEDFDGVIEFGDGTQYKIEHKPNLLQEAPQERSMTPPEPEGPPVAKEERFGEDMGRNWPRRHGPAGGQPSINKPSLRLSVSSRPASEAPSQIQSPHDSISPTSRVLFNERLNRLEPLSESKVPFGPRSREPALASQTYPSNIQLLQKGLPGADFKSRGPPRGPAHGAEWGPWGDNTHLRGSPITKHDERPWESRRRESVSSATGSSIRDRSRGRESRWEPLHHTTGANRDNIQRAPNVPLVPPTLTRERDGNRTNHFRAPPLTSVSPSRGSERSIFQSNASHVSPTVSTQSLHSPILEKTQLTGSQPTDNLEDIDKNALLKNAMHLANERARRRKQESDEEERRREEAAERARKKAEALARAMEDKQKSESQTSSEPPTQLKSVEQTEPKSVTIIPSVIQQPGREPLVKRPSTDYSMNPPSLLLSRRSTTSTPAVQAESWRSRGPPKGASAETQNAEKTAEVKTDLQPAPSVLSPSDNSVAPPFSFAPSNDLLIKPDEEVEVVDFEDLGKLLGNAPQEPRVSPKPVSRLSSRPVASDFFQDDFVEPEALTWRRSAIKPQPTPAVDGLRTQTIPMFPTISSPEAELSTMEPKSSRSPSHSPSTKLLSQGDQVSNNPQISPVLSALRSPRASHFREAPMSALTDTMSRIKGALDGMQSQDMLILSKDNVSADKAKHNASEFWRTLHDDDAPQQLNLVPLRLGKPEDFVSRVPRPASPKPVWNTYTIKIPRVCQHREPLPKKQVHYWNLPYSPVRWDILSWDPPVEGMNKRDLSRDDIFHKKYLPKGSKLRVLLPASNSEQARISQTSSNDTSTTSTTMVTAVGVKIKLPSGPSPFRPAIPSSPLISTESTHDVFSVSSWRRSANASNSLKTEQFQVISVITKEGLNTTSRSPPPDPFTPLPQLTPTKRGIPTSFESSVIANVSLPSTDSKLTDKELREAVSSLRMKESVIREQSTSTPLPSFTVNSELELSALDPLDQASSAPETSKTDSKSLPSQSQAFTLTFPVKDSPTRRGPDPEHLKAVWSQTTPMSTGSTSNSLKGITDEQLPSIPLTMQDMKSEGGETPPPSAPAPPSRLSQQEVARAFQQVPESPASRAPIYPQNSFLAQHRPNHAIALSHSVRPSYPPAYHPHAVMNHSPSPTLMYTPGVGSPVLHQRIPVNGPSPSVTSGVWLPTPPPVPSQHGNYLRPAGAPPPPTHMVYPPPPGTTAPNQMIHHRMTIMSQGSIPPAPPAMQANNLYAPAPMPDMRNMHVRSPHMAHTMPAHPHAVPMQTMQTMHHPMFSPPPHPPPPPHPHPGHSAQQQAMYALPTGTNRGAMVPRNVYEGYHAMPPPAGYPNTPYIFPS